MTKFHKLEAPKEEADAGYLQSAIGDGEASVIMDMVREMDEIVHLLGIEDSFETPCEAIRKLMASAPNARTDEGNSMSEDLVQAQPDQAEPQRDHLVSESVYRSAVQGRRDFREAYRRERERADRFEVLLAEAKEHVIDWSTGVNSDLLARIGAALASPPSPDEEPQRGDTALPLDQHQPDTKHYSDCSVHNMPAFPNGPCDCGGY